MAEEHNWVSQWLEATEELELSSFEQSLADARKRAMERKALLIEFAGIVKQLQELEDSLWKTWR